MLPPYSLSLMPSLRRVPSKHCGPIWQGSFSWSGRLQDCHCCPRCKEHFNRSLLSRKLFTYKVTQSSPSGFIHVAAITIRNPMWSHMYFANCRMTFTLFVSASLGGHIVILLSLQQESKILTCASHLRVGLRQSTPLRVASMPHVFSPPACYTKSRPRSSVCQCMSCRGGEGPGTFSPSFC